MSSRLFADYQPRASDGSGPAQLLGLVIRPGRVGDAEAVAGILWERNGGSLAVHASRYLARLSGSDRRQRLDLVAELDGQLAGYGQVFLFVPPADAPTNAAPRGWYLSGVNVREHYRRRGIAAALTRRRLDWVARRSSDVYYFANSLNLASIDLHASLGFVEVTRDFWFPGVSFQGGAGVLFRLDLAPPAGARKEAP